MKQKKGDEEETTVSYSPEPLEILLGTMTYERSFLLWRSKAEEHILTLPFALAIFNNDLTREDKYKTWLSFKVTDRSFACPKCSTQTHGIYPLIEMERLAKLFVDRMLDEDDIPFQGMDGCKEIDYKNVSKSKTPDMTKLASDLDLNCSIKSSFFRHKL